MLPGIHHVTAIASDPQQNYEFYAGFLGLRLVKKTVNFDDPGTYHLYFGDERGGPGTIMTFFPWPGAHRGRIGAGQATVTSFAVPEGSLPFWTERAKSRGIDASQSSERFGEKVLSFADSDGLRIELIEAGPPSRSAWTGSGVPADSAIMSFHSVTLSEEGFERTAVLLEKTMRFTAGAVEGNRYRFRAEGRGAASIVDLLCIPDGRRGLQGAGTVHHIAFRTPDDEAQAHWRTRIAEAGLNVTPVMDRNYFRSIYFREPGGVLFEIATDPPGFTIDEPAERLGTSLKLPPWYESERARIESILPVLKTLDPSHAK
jgi:glyoxalase family protein